VIRAAILASIFAVGLAVTLQSPQEQTSAALAQLNPYLNAIGDAQLAQRAQTIAALRTKSDAERRQADVRKTILGLVGGLPAITGPVSVKRFATVEDDGFHIENVAYESAPGYWVAANVYVPAGTGPFPAMVIVPGHGPGKAWQYSFGAAFARAGIVTLSIDAMGQGERLQHVDPATGKSKIEPLGEHEHANQTALLIGEHVARYWFADGIRGVDYLIARGDILRDRIGTFGCSGGGTAAAYLAAMDPRIRVAAVASFITSFHELMPGNGPQDAEQTLPRFLASGLDFADWVELAAPRPLAIVAFEQDFFPVAGAAGTYDEAKRFYSLYGAGEDIRFIRGGGGHCNLAPVMPEVMGFLVQRLKGPDSPSPGVERRQPKSADTLTVTPTGQVSTSLGSASIEDLTRRDARSLAVEAAPLNAKAVLARLRERVRRDVRQLAGVVATPADRPRATTTPLQTLEGYRLEAVRLESEPGITLDGILAIPGGSGRHPAVVLMDASPLDAAAGTAEFSRLAAAGHVVLAFHPRGVLGEPPPHPEQLALGQYMPVLLRAIVVGKTLVGMRVDDTIRAVSWLESRDDVDPSSVTLRSTGALGLVALHAAALDDRITRVAVAKTLVSYRMALEAELHRNLSEILIPGVLTRYDVGDLIAVITPRRVVVDDPVDALGQPVKP
jgi:cephalosporin-C deacetylase-like acetyl esterase